jgi:hypothetical protein
LENNNGLLVQFDFLAAARRGYDSSQYDFLIDAPELKFQVEKWCMPTHWQAQKCVLGLIVSSCNRTRDVMDDDLSSTNVMDGNAVAAALQPTRKILQSKQRITSNMTKKASIDT